MFSALVLLASCQTVKDPGDFTTAPLMGMVYYAGNNACSNAAVTISETGEGNAKEYETVTDVYGKFSISEVKKGEHKISVSRDGFETNEFIFNFSKRTQAIYVYLLSETDLLKSLEESLAKKKYDEAAGFAERTLALNEKNTKALYLGAGAFIKLGQADKARGYIQKLETMDPSNSYIKVLEADISEYIENDYGKALEILDGIPAALRDDYIKERIKSLEQKL